MLKADGEAQKAERGSLTERHPLDEMPSGATEQKASLIQYPSCKLLDIWVLSVLFVLIIFPAAYILAHFYWNCTISPTFPLIHLCWARCTILPLRTLKATVHPKIKIVSSYTHPQVFPNL